MPHDRIARPQNRAVSSLVCLRSGVRLNIDVFRFEKLLRAVPGQVLHLVGPLASTVVALAGVALGVLVRQDAAGGFEHGFRGEILAGDQLDLAILPPRFFLDQFIDCGVDLG